MSSYPGTPPRAVRTALRAYAAARSAPLVREDTLADAAAALALVVYQLRDELPPLKGRCADHHAAATTARIGNPLARAAAAAAFADEYLREYGPAMGLR